MTLVIQSSNEQSEIARTIRKQLLAGGAMTVFSWGTHNLRVLPKTELYQGGLAFSVNGALYQGPVHILLDYFDTYTIEFRENKRFTGVYFDMLTSLIDSEVEQS